MTHAEASRRPGYAPRNSAAVGRRGLRTRDRIVACAAQLFVVRGFHGTSIDDIAREVGGSRATVYQYFGSTSAIFAELYRRFEPAVLDHGHRLGHVGPDADGVRNLHHWLLEWGQLYDRYATVFLEFPGIGAIAGVPQQNSGSASDRFAAIITAKLRDAGVQGVEAADAAAAMLRIVHMVNLYRFRGMFNVTESTRTSRTLTIAVQLLLFPETPAEALAAVGPAVDQSGPPPRVAAEPNPPPPPARSDTESRAGVLSTAARLLAERGYYAVSMEDIATAATVSRATLYRHFNTKVKILAALTELAVLRCRQLADELRLLTDVGPDPVSLRKWLSHFVSFHRTYCGVTRAWYDGSAAQQLPVDAVTEGMGALHTVVTVLLSRVGLPDGMDRDVAGAIFLAVLGRLSEPSAVRPPEDSDDDIATMMLAVLGRALLGGGEWTFVHPKERSVRCD